MFACCLFFVTACGETHKAAEKWTADETSHWHACVVDGCEEKYDEEAHTFENDICTVCFYGAEARIGTKGYKTLAEALDAAQNGDTVVLVKDLTGAGISVDKNITIDFGGCTYTSTTSGFDVAWYTPNTELTLKNGKLQTTIWGCWLQKSAILNVENDFEIVANTAEEAGRYGIVVTQGAKLNLRGKVTAKSNAAVSGLGNEGDGDVVINIYAGAVLTSLDSTAIYIPNTHELNIMGGTITGVSALYSKSGKTTISGGNFIATGAKQDYRYNGGGYYETGDAITIDACCRYPGGDPEVVITGGTFVSANGYKIAHYTRADITNRATITNSTDVEIKEISVPASAFATTAE